MKNFIVISVALLLPALGLNAQSYAIDWHKVAGGGGTSTGGVYSVSGTAGQPDTGSMIGGNYVLVGGYSSLIAIVPTTGAPTLTIFRTTTNTVVVSWPSPSTGFNPEQINNLISGTWISAPETVVDDGTKKYIVV